MHCNVEIPRHSVPMWKPSVITLAKVGTRARVRTQVGRKIQDLMKCFYIVGSQVPDYKILLGESFQHYMSFARVRQIRPVVGPMKPWVCRVLGLLSFGGKVGGWEGGTPGGVTHLKEHLARAHSAVRNS